MAEILDKLFGPISKEYCLLFYFFSIYGFVAMVLLLLIGLFIGITKRRGIDWYLGILSVSLFYFVIYLQNRLLHTMCVAK